MVKFNKAIFKSSHNSYSGDLCGRKGSIQEQLNNGILGIELDIYGLKNFQIGHKAPGHEVDLRGIKCLDSEMKFSLHNWLEPIKQWSDENQNLHPPITLFLDIRLIIEHSIYYDYEELNNVVKKIFNDSIFSPRDLNNSDWPDVNKLRGKIIIVLTGEKGVKWRYINKIKNEKRNCFASFSYKLDGNGKSGKGKELLENSQFINVRINDWKWANEQFKKEKIIRLYYFDEIFKLKSYYKCKNIKCNFPATDYPYGEIYNEFLKTLSNNHLEMELIGA
ncbi:MAG: hypothetical protein EAX96_15985 [Candidatus Lokiarchaeota archaeon]|nr:hypothetical protein [Candidatus Lokiarchaeota archaeon]